MQLLSFLATALIYKLNPPMFCLVHLWKINPFITWLLTFTPDDLMCYRTNNLLRCATVCYRANVKSRNKWLTGIHRCIVTQEILYSNNWTGPSWFKKYHNYYKFTIFSLHSVCFKVSWLHPTLNGLWAWFCIVFLECKWSNSPLVGSEEL